MKPSVTNLQRTVSVNVPLLEENVKRIKRVMGISKFRVNVWLRSDKMVQRMNKIDRNVDKPTDVLSYSYQRIPAGTVPKYTKENKYLGEIVFGMGYIQDYCEKKGKSLDRELERLTVHGMCHILGYDHELDADYEKMHALEMDIMKRLKQLRKIEKEEEKRADIFSPSSGTLSASDAANSLLIDENENGESKKKVLKKVASVAAVKKKVTKKKKKKSDSSSSSSSSSSSFSSSSSSSSSSS